MASRSPRRGWGRAGARCCWGLGAALVVSLLLSLAIGLFSLRVRAIFFAMITLAVASAFQTLASQLSDFTGGEDGLTFKLPELISPSFEFAEEPFLGVSLDGRLLCYYLLFVAAVVLVLALLRIVNSPFGRVLQAIRENEFRAEAIGYRVVVYRTTASVLSALFATLAGAMLAIWLRYNGPDTSLSFEIMIDVLLIVVIGGMGHDVRRGHRRRALRGGAELPAGPAAAGQRGGKQRLLAGGAAVAGPLAALAGPALRALCLLLPDRHRRPASREGPAMNAPTSNYLQIAGREIHWMDWGGQGDPVVVAWHGLARTCRDMDELAVHFSERGFRVVCPDTLGRGLSQWSPVPDDEYQLAF